MPSDMPPQNSRTGRWLGFWPTLAFFLLLSLALNHNYMRGGFYLDDLFFVNAMRMDPVPFSRWRGIWCG
ncbi:MAG: hypothetical protein FJ278_25185, partial [Planctomycetes bacterium]|nr:hypothetical protein [Planctomycetota bacterium]